MTSLSLFFYSVSTKCHKSHLITAFFIKTYLITVKPPIINLKTVQRKLGPKIGLYLHKTDLMKNTNKLVNTNTPTKKNKQTNKQKLAAAHGRQKKRGTDAVPKRVLINYIKCGSISAKRRFL